LLRLLYCLLLSVRSSGIIKIMIVAIDYGEVNIGIAVTDEENRFVFPKCVIKTALLLKYPAMLTQQIPDFSKVTEIVVGLPLNLKGEHTPQTDKAIHFADWLHQNFLSVTVVTYDERLSSALVLKRHQLLGGHQKDLKASKDMLEAAQILEDYLRRKANENR